MKLSAVEKKIIEGTHFPTLVTVCEDGTPHPIVTDRGRIVGETIVFGITAMVKTQKNLSRNTNAWFVFVDKQPRGCRICGTAEVKGRNLIFTPFKVDMLY